MLYMALAPNEKIEYGKAGPAGPARFEEGVQGYESRAFRGLGVFTSTPFEVNDDTDSLQLLQRNTQVGEFYRMSTPALLDKATDRSMDITIYDEEADRFQHITIEEAIKACPIWNDDADGTIRNDFLPADVTLAELGLDGVVSAKDAAKKAKDASDGDKNACPFDVIIVRPFIEHNMMSCVMTVAGRDTGATLFGPAGVFLPFCLSYILILTCASFCCADMQISVRPILLDHSRIPALHTFWDAIRRWKTTDFNVTCRSQISVTARKS